MTDAPNSLVMANPERRLALGWAAKSRLGWRFLPFSTARKPSRKHWNTAEECVPRWAKQDGFRLMTKEEANQHGLGLR